MGIDNSIVFERVMVSKPFQKPPNYDSIIESIRYRSYGAVIFDKTNRYWSKDYYSNDVYLIGFCGQFFLAYRFQHFLNDEIKESKTHYQPSSIVDYFNDLKVKYKVDEPSQLRGWRHVFPLTLNELEQIYSQNLLKQRFDDWFHYFKTPIFAIELESNCEKESISLRNEECHVILNPLLKDFEFYKVKDAFSCFQSIQQYLSGVLTNTEINTSSMTDKEKINARGFDPVYGFRKRPKKK